MSFIDTSNNNKANSASIFDTPVPQWRCRCIYVPQAVPALADSAKDLILESLKYETRKQCNGSNETIQSK
jgi:hypothetical protein